jgi:hypothetical protein
MPCSAGDRQYEFVMTKSGSEKIVSFGQRFWREPTIALGTWRDTSRTTKQWTGTEG